LPAIVGFQTGNRTYAAQVSVEADELMGAAAFDQRYMVAAGKRQRRQADVELQDPLIAAFPSKLHACQRQERQEGRLNSCPGDTVKTVESENGLENDRYDTRSRNISPRATAQNGSYLGRTGVRLNSSRLTTMSMTFRTDWHVR